MEIVSKLKSQIGQEYIVKYQETDPLNNLEGKILQCVHAFCFYKDKLVLVKHPKSGWMPPGGGIEENETIEQAVVREVKEETNMKVLSQKIIGFQDIYESDRVLRQVRSFCIVEPYGDFISDPDGEISEIKLIDPKDFKEYFDWGEIGDRLMEKVMNLKTSKLD